MHFVHSEPNLKQVTAANLAVNDSMVRDTDNLHFLMASFGFPATTDKDTCLDFPHVSARKNPGR